MDDVMDGVTDDVMDDGIVYNLVHTQVSVVAPVKAATSKAPKATTNLAAMTLAMFGGLEMAPAPSTTKSKAQSTPDNKVIIISSLAVAACSQYRLLMIITNSTYFTTLAQCLNVLLTSADHHMPAANILAFYPACRCR
eukprot:scpid92293/ scgid5783/ 